MLHDKHLVTEGWSEYELLDSGEGAKLERFGAITLARPETQALWSKREPELWRGAAAAFTSGERGAWEKQKSAPSAWQLSWEHVRMTLRLTSFKHVGLFPEQAPNWKWTRERVNAGLQRLGTVSEGAKPGTHAFSVLNLFGYTGAASIVAAQAGAKVTHVDASKQSLDWAHENARLSGLPDDAVRWLPDDALAFVKREVRRGARYDGIILDPPAFGRGPKGEVWHIERDLPALLAALHELLVERPGAFFLMSAYAAGYAPRSLAQAVESAFGPLPRGESGLSGVALAESGELHIKESGSDRVIPSGIYCRFVR